MKVKGKVFVVTGGGSGMGRELVLQLVKLGARVAIIDVNETTMEETAEMAGKSNVSTHKIDITNREAVNNLPELVIQEHGAVDGLINNAGIIHPFVNIEELAYSVIERVMDINFYGTLNMTKSFLPHLLTRPEAHIANISSMGGFIPFPGQTIYGASKAAVKLLTEGLYAELKGTKVGVTIIHPGAVNTNIMINSGIKTEDEMDAQQAQSNIALPAQKAAAIMIRAIEHNKFRITVGKDARILDILYRLMPRRAVNIITKQMAKYKQ